MIEYLFVLVIESTHDENHRVYIGHFQDCYTANEFAEDYLPDFRSICLHENFMNIPKKLKDKIIFIKKGKRWKKLKKI